MNHETVKPTKAQNEETNAKSLSSNYPDLFLLW